MDIFTQLPPPPAAPPQQDARAKRWIPLVIAAGIVLLAGLSMVSVFAFKKLARSIGEPGTALRLYTDSLIREDYHTAYNLASPEFRTGSSYDALVEYHRGLKTKNGPLKNVTQTYWDVKTNNGVISSTIQARLTFEHQKQLFEFILHKENGVWRVFSYKPVYGESSSDSGIQNN